MEIVWSRAKNHWLKARRNVSFDDVVPILLEKRYLAVLENPSRADQMIFLIRYHDFTYVVPFEIDGDRIVLKTIFPSRKFHKIYGKKNSEGRA
jgi:hypothetical protein